MANLRFAVQPEGAGEIVDWIIAFGVESAGPSLVEKCRLGVIAFAINDQPVHSADDVTAAVVRGAFGFARVQLRRLDENGLAELLAEARLETTDDLARTADLILPELPVLVLRFLSGEPLPGASISVREPTSPLGTHALSAARRLRWLSERYLWDDEWQLGVSRNSVESIVRQSGEVDFAAIPTPASVKFLADPFGWVNGDLQHLIFEAYDADDRRGYIAVATLAELAEGKIEKLLDSTSHLSYPFMFSHRGKLYCTPETHESREVVLYELDRDNRALTRVATLLRDVAACDPTIFEHEGRLWLFATSADAGANSRLFGWWADDLVGPWHPHLLQPMKSDVSSARPAGRPFYHDGQLMRPAQDCSRTYGGRVVINRIVELSPTTFREEPFAALTVPAGFDGAHTLSAVGDHTVIDLKRRRFLPFAPRLLGQRYRGALRASLRKILGYLPL